jgi:hypothetical protein
MTNKIELRTVEQFMSDYVPTYAPIYPLFLGKSQAYPKEVGKKEFRRVQTVGSIRGEVITPKDTEIKQVAVMSGKKTFKSYFLANQFQLSEFQSREGIEEIVAQVLDEHNRQADDLFLLGEGTSASTMLNNGLFWSNDPNYTLEDSASLDDELDAIHTAIVGTAKKANQVAGRKVIVLYGDTLLPFYNSLYSGSSKAFKVALAEVLGPNYSVVEMPEDCTPSGTDGWIVGNLDQCKLHYTVFPELLAQGFNEEKMYYWSNFLMGSMMLEVLARNAVIRQPVTIS